MTITELSYALDTLFILLSAALVMWMAAGFSMLEAGLVRTKNTTEILVKNILLYALACLCYFFFGYHLMYGHAAITDYSPNAYLFFQMVFVATAMSIVFRRSCGTHETLDVSCLYRGDDQCHLSACWQLDLGWRIFKCYGLC